MKTMATVLLAFSVAFIAGAASPAVAGTAVSEASSGAPSAIVESAGAAAEQSVNTEPSPSATTPASNGYGGEVSGGGKYFPILLVAGIVLAVGALLVAVLRLGHQRRAQDARDAARRITDA